MFEEIKAPTIKELFIQRIEDGILSGELPKGTKLPSERELAEQMKISKTAVHNGITDLERKGFLKVIPRKGIFVADYASEGTLEALVSIMQHEHGNLDSQNVVSMLEVRDAIECIAVRHVMENDPETTIAKLKELAAQASAIAAKDPVNYTALAETYFRFHHTLCVDSGNIIVSLILNAFHTPALRMWANSARALGLKDSVGRLYGLIETMETGDIEKACQYIHWICGSSKDIVND